MEEAYKYKEGEVVYEKLKPAIKLVIRRYVRSIYYCTVLANPHQKDLVFFENELTQ